MPRPSRLPLVTDPLPGESIISWLQASASAMLFSVQDLLTIAGIPPSITRRNLLLHLEPEWVACLASATSAPVDVIESMTLAGLNASLHADARSAAAVGLGSAAIARYCPRCLQHTHGRWPLRWHTPWSFFCVEHDTFLTQRVPVPLAEFWRLVDDLSNVDPRPVPAPADGRSFARAAQTWLDEQLVGPSAIDVVTGLHLLTVRLVRADMSMVADAMGEPYRTAVTEAQIADHGPGRRHVRQGRVALSYQISPLVLTVATEWTRRVFRARTQPEATEVIRTELEAELNTVAASPDARLKRWGGQSPTLTAAVLPLIKGARRDFRVALQYGLGTPISRRPNVTGRELAERARKIPSALWPDLTATVWRPALGPVATFRRACATALIHVGAKEITHDVVERYLGPHRGTLRPLVRLDDDTLDFVSAILIDVAQSLDRSPVEIDYVRRRELPTDDLLPAVEWNVITQSTGFRCGPRALVAARTLLRHLIIGDAPVRLPDQAGLLFGKMPRATFDEFVRYGERWLTAHLVFEPLTEPGPSMSADRRHLLLASEFSSECRSLLLELNPSARNPPGRRRRPRYTDDAFRALYVEQRLTTFEIADRLCMSAPAVQRHLRAAGVTLRPRGRASRPVPARQLPVGDLPLLLRALSSNGALERVLRFADLVQYPTTTIAARSLGLDQSTLSVQLTRLEKDTGVTLITRAERGRPQQVTESGQALLVEFDVLKSRRGVATQVCRRES